MRLRRMVTLPQVVEQEIFIPAKDLIGVVSEFGK